ncbi:hypothetical protein BDK51DRAFT_26871 [Blyttiomyces helicus]|uniref:EGF-like domain-containing protein n=1 Tax=Blyttiomyces helicus TaxID=388810 RepID=A0A4P9W8H2_9FUNG|nr:hypothetical protein BDK51DRAFT_26871 [Blyttiomyces helicus]|eukprot:RKO86466.1 hypothetical protein BDK51DRAFT_26871 [Blyttiomyces helicus]
MRPFSALALLIPWASVVLRVDAQPQQPAATFSQPAPPPAPAQSPTTSASPTLASTSVPLTSVPPTTTLVPSSTVSASATFTVTVTTSSVLPSPQPTCPVCFDCLVTGCKHGGNCDSHICSCPGGWGGPDCGQAICTKDSACKGGPNAASGGNFVCNTSPTVIKASSAYCNLSEPLLHTIYPDPSWVTLERNVTSGNASAVVWYQEVEQFSCQIGGCSQNLAGTTTLAVV